jgi:hypothetical protein
MKGLGHLWRPPNFTAGNKLPPEDSFPKCHWHFSPPRIFGSVQSFIRQKKMT